jgi:hypothetical protein
MLRVIVKTYVKAKIDQGPTDDDPNGPRNPLESIRRTSQAHKARTDLDYYLAPHQKALQPMIQNLDRAIQTYGTLRQGIPTVDLVNATSHVVSAIEDLVLAAQALDIQNPLDY